MPVFSHVSGGTVRDFIELTRQCPIFYSLLLPPWCINIGTYINVYTDIGVIPSSPLRYFLHFWC